MLAGYLMTEEPTFLNKHCGRLLTLILKMEIMLHKTAGDLTVLQVHIDAVFSASFAHKSPLYYFRRRFH